VILELNYKAVRRIEERKSWTGKKTVPENGPQLHKGNNLVREIDHEPSPPATAAKRR
jgi:hypothetical protein